MADPDFETTETVPVRIAGIDGLQIDGVVTAQWDTNWSLCYPMWTTNAQVFRMRLYLIDYPAESAQVLTIAIIAPEPDFERVLEEARTKSTATLVEGRPVDVLCDVANRRSCRNDERARWDRPTAGSQPSIGEMSVGYSKVGAVRTARRRCDALCEALNAR